MKIIRPWTLASLLLAASILAACIVTTTTPPTVSPPAVPPPTIATITAPNGDVITATVVQAPPVWTYNIKSNTVDDLKFSDVWIISTVAIDDCNVTFTSPTTVGVNPMGQKSWHVQFSTIGNLAGSVVIVLNCNQDIAGPPVNLTLDYTYYGHTLTPLKIDVGPLAGPKVP